MGDRSLSRPAWRVRASIADPSAAGVRTRLSESERTIPQSGMPPRRGWQFGAHFPVCSWHSLCVRWSGAPRARMPMETLLQDVRFALRVLRKAPGATAVAVLSLALGLSVNTPVFSWTRTVLLNPLPGVARQDRIVTLETVAASGEMIDS